MGRFLDLIKPLQVVLPEVQPPERQRIKLDEKLFWTGVALLIYLVCSQLPLFGIPPSSSGDPFYLMRMILASSKGSLMELGISPIITSGMIMQVLSGAQIIDIDQNLSEDRQLFNAASKVLGILITLGEALGYVLAGMYGDPAELGLIKVLLLVAQLFFGGIIVLTLDDLLSKGYGLGGGLNLFIVTNICEGIIWKAFSPTNLNGQFEGVFPALIATIFTDPLSIPKVLVRSSAPNALNLAATVLVFLVVIYVQGWKIDLKIVPQNGQRGQAQIKPIKLFYTSNMPIILLSTLVSNVYFLSQVLYRKYPTNILINLLGRWTDERTGNSHPVGGLAYYVSPPQSFAAVVDDPFHALFYFTFMLSTCALFARFWIELSGTGPGALYKQLKDSKQEIEHKHGNATLKELKKIIPPAAAFGGVCVAALSIFADLLGAIGSGTGILMCVTIIYELYENLKREIEMEYRYGGGASSWVAPLVGIKQA